MNAQLTQPYGSLRTNHFVGWRGFSGWSRKTSVDAWSVPSWRPRNGGHGARAAPEEAAVPGHRAAGGGRRAELERAARDVAQVEAEPERPVVGVPLDRRDVERPRLVQPPLTGLRDPGQALHQQRLQAVPA